MKKTNKLLALLLVVTLIFGGTAYASFPVKNETKKEQAAKSTQEQLKAAQLKHVEQAQSVVKEDATNAPMPADDEKLILILLWFFLGGLAAHRWYAGKPIGWNILFILTAGGCGVWAIIDLIAIIKDEF